jgi:hypothetical protein
MQQQADCWLLITTSNDLHVDLHVDCCVSLSRHLILVLICAWDGLLDARGQARLGVVGAACSSGSKTDADEDAKHCNTAISEPIKLQNHNVKNVACTVLWNKYHALANSQSLG